MIGFFLALSCYHAQARERNAHVGRAKRSPQAATVQLLYVFLRVRKADTGVVSVGQVTLAKTGLVFGRAACAAAALSRLNEASKAENREEPPIHFRPVVFRSIRKGAACGHRLRRLSRCLPARRVLAHSTTIASVTSKPYWRAQRHRG